MFAGVSGLRSHQAFMDVVGNNIANVNTTGYKTSNVLFQDLLSQSIRGGGAPTAGTQGGTNPAQVGLGVRLAGVTLNMAQGASQLTGRSTDFAIQGDGFFVIDQGGTRAYTRAGSFSLDGLGQLVSSEGGFVQGWQASSTGAVDTNASVGMLRIPVGQTIAPVATTTMDIGGNLPADVATGTNINASINVYNTLGTAVPLRAEFRKIANVSPNVNWEVRVYDATNTVIHAATPVTFNASGALTTGNVTVTQAELNAIAGTSGTWGAGGIALNFGTATDPDRLTGAAQLNSVGALSQDGSGIGSLRRAPDRRRGPGRPRQPRRWNARDVERRPRRRVHQPDRRPAGIPGELPHHHRIRRDPAGSRQPQALISVVEAG